VAAARKVLGQAAVLGATCRDPASARAAVVAGASYLGVGPAYPTVTKTGLPGPLGPAGVGAVAQSVRGTPVIAIGGVTVDGIQPLLDAGAHGVAVVGALADAADPARAATELLKALS
jgi:thiamine-phosphate pyrophosphorylase